jgi:Leucine-rich repeat (LRR) protein
MLKQMECLKLAESLVVLPSFRSMCSHRRDVCRFSLGIDKNTSPEEIENMKSRFLFLQQNEKRGEEGVLSAIAQIDEMVDGRPTFFNALRQWIGLQDTEMRTREIAANKLLRAYDKASTELNLSKLQLTSLPSAITQLGFLQQINLSGNKLSSLPVSLQSMEHLGHLNIAHNQFAQLPEHLPKNLTELVVAGNPVAQDESQIQTFETTRELPILIHTQEDYEVFLKSLSDS